MTFVEVLEVSTVLSCWFIL